MANPKMTKQWFTLAVRDLKAARALLSLGSDFKAGAVFHAQQCAEKAIKGFLVNNEIRPPKTHSIKVLTEIDEQLAK